MMTGTHTALIPLTLGADGLDQADFDALVEWAARTGAYHGGLAVVQNDYAAVLLQSLNADPSLTRKVIDS